MCFLFLNWAYLYIQQLLFINANGIAMKSLLSFCITYGLLKVLYTPGFSHPNCITLAESLWELHVLSTDRWFLGVRDLMLSKAD